MTASREFLAYSKNDIAVWYQAHGSHAATHMADTLNLRQLAAEVLSQTVLDADYVQTHQDLGRIVGLCDLVVNRPGDDIVYATRLNRTEYTAFNKSQPPRPSSLVTVAVQKQPDTSYELLSAWIGPSDSPSFPGTERETADSKAFWETHALAWGTQKVHTDTVTSVCPWE